MRVSHKDGVGSLVESEWVSAVLRQPINQPFEHLSPPLPVSALRATAGRQESTGSHRVRIQQTYFFLLI